MILNYRNFSRNPRNITFTGNFRDGYDLTIIIRGLASGSVGGNSFSIMVAGFIVRCPVQSNTSIILKYVKSLNEWFTYNSNF